MTHPNHSVHNIYIRPGTNLAIISYYVDGTRVIDISDPENPIEVGYYDTTGFTGLYYDNLEPDVAAKFLSYPIPKAIVEEWAKVK